MPFSDWDLRKAAKIPGALEHFEGFATRFLQETMECIRNEHENRIEGHFPITQVIFIVNCKDFPLGQLLNLGAIRNIIALGTTYEAHYPEIMYKAILINVPSYFGIGIAALKQVMAPKTMSKLCSYSTMANWKKDMIEVLDPAILPERYGGTADVKKGI
ncbi:unnamed protein product [Orchesella dallaii]|uniref:CRAL-TRIO domain-containing protein n=1 Tax=Orchesella dallaii TaxID=48710 RepID=A0ABP1RFJ6_9HEXA